MKGEPQGGRGLRDPLHEDDHCLGLPMLTHRHGTLLARPSKVVGGRALKWPPNEMGGPFLGTLKMVGFLL